MSVRRIALTAALLAGGLVTAPAAPLQAQVAWDGPLMVAPATPAGWGVYLIDPAGGRGVGVMSTWRTGGTLGYRVGLAEDAGQDLAVFGGIDASGAFLSPSDDFPLAVNWVTGAGFGIGDSFLLSFPFGVSIGAELETDGVWFHPYLLPRVVLDARLGGGNSNQEDLSLGLAVDLGLDLSFTSSWAIRFAGSIGDRNALGIGVSFRVL